jgi:putative methionine-R-sulfoxide reductase with GAF domain/HAMP domain-containing protein
MFQFSVRRLILLFLIVLASANMVALFSFYQQGEREEAAVQWAERCATLSQQMALYANLYVSKGDSMSKINCIQATEMHNQILFSLKNGGKVSESDKYELKPIGDEAAATMKKSQVIWEQYKRNTQIILEEQTYVDMSFILPNMKNIGNLDKNKYLNPKVKTSLEYVNQNAIRMLSTNEELAEILRVSLLRHQNFFETVFLLCLATSILIIILSYFIFNKFLVKPIQELAIKSSLLAHGDYEQDIPDYSGKGEIGELALSLNILFRKLKSAVKYVKEIGKGNMEVNANQVFKDDYAEGDTFIKALELTKVALNSSIDEQKRRGWVNEGMASVSRLLTERAEDISELSRRLILEMVKRMEGSQGGIYLVEKGMLVLKASYAYDRHKYLRKQIQINEGVIGEAWAEASTILLDNMPDEYQPIDAGLGEIKPRCLLIVPIKTDREVVGVMEIASLRSFENYQISFAEKACENMAISLYSVKVKMETEDLFRQSQQLNEQLKAQEEEMRQNLEELQSTQEEMKRKETGYLKKIQDLESELNVFKKGKVLN